MRNLSPSYISCYLKLAFPSCDVQEIVLSMEDRDAEELVLLLQGYYRLLTGKILSVEQDRDLSWIDDAGKSLVSSASFIALFLCCHDSVFIYKILQLSTMLKSYVCHPYISFPKLLKVV